MKHTLLFILVTLLAIPSVAQDQAEPLFLVSSYQCDRSRLDDVLGSNGDQSGLGIQAMVDEGKIVQAGQAEHLWGDEYNLIMWLGAADVASAVAAWEEMMELWGDSSAAEAFLDACPVHRDVFYRRLAGTVGPPPPMIEEGNEPVLAVSYFQCPYTELGAIIEEHTSRMLPITQKLVDDGELGTEQVYRHEYGDEWNLMFVRSARDIASLQSSVGTVDDEYERMYGDEPSALDQHCTAHKDNLYSIVMITQPAE